MSKVVKNENGRPEMAAVIERMIGADEFDVVDVAKFVAPAIAELLGDELKEKQEQAKTDESVELTARFEFRNLFVVTAQIEAAETKDVRNPKTGEVVKDKYFPARVKCHFKASPILEDLIEKHINLDKS